MQAGQIMGRLIRSFGALVLLLALASGARRLLERNAPIPPPGPGERDTVVDGVRWRSRESDSQGAETVVYVHGLISSSASFGKVLASAAAGRPAIAVDLPGSGFSDRPWPYDYTVGSQARSLLRFLEVRQIDRAILIGNSLGGAVALLAAAAQPRRVSALVLVDAASPATRIPLTIRALRTPIVGEIEMELFIRPLMEWGLRHRLYAQAESVTDAVVEDYWRPVTVPGTRRAALAAIRSSSRGYEDLVQRIRAPTLVLWGKEDRLLPASDGLRLASEISGARLVVLPGAGHLPQEEAPEEFSRAVSDFLRQTVSETPGGGSRDEEALDSRERGP